MKRSGLPSISPCANGHNSIVSIRPGSASGNVCSPTTRADPVSRNWPGSGRVSTRALIERRSSGSRWISSMIIGFVPATNSLGSSRAASRISLSSKVYHSASPRQHQTANLPPVSLQICRQVGCRSAAHGEPSTALRIAPFSGQTLAGRRSQPLNQRRHDRTQDKQRSGEPTRSPGRASCSPLYTPQSARKVHQQ